MKLYYFPFAPNPTRVRLYLAEKAHGGATIPLETEVVNLVEGAQKTPDFLAKNPRGKLPVLELDDGSCVSESPAIIEYFEERYPDPPMIGTTPEERLLARSVDRLADIEALMPIAGLVHSTRSPLGLPPDSHTEARCRERLAAGLTMLDALLARNEFLAGDRVSIADCTLFAAIGFAAFFGHGLGDGLGEQFPNVQRWHAMYAARPSATLP
jgi:glutathione S-transferase